MHRVRVYLCTGLLATLSVASSDVAAAGAQRAATNAARAAADTPEQALLNRYCVTCHNDRLRTGGLALDTLDVSDVGAHAEVWEKVVRKLRGGVMPPVGWPRPDEDANDSLASWLETELDEAWAARPNPGRTDAFHRLNRAEYRNAIRDLLAIDLEIVDFLPADNASYGLRQHRRRAQDVAVADGALSLGGTDDQPHGSGQCATGGRFRGLPCPRGHATAA